MGKTIRGFNGRSKKQKKDLIKSFQTFRQNRQNQRRVQESHTEFGSGFGIARRTDDLNAHTSLVGENYDE